MRNHYNCSWVKLKCFCHRLLSSNNIVIYPMIVLVPRRLFSHMTCMFSNVDSALVLQFVKYGFVHVFAICKY